jgi:hypothetical protein
MRALLIGILFVGLGCPHNPTPTPVPPTPGAMDASGPATCADVCQHESVLGCSGAQPTPNGASCVEVCANVQASGIISWDLVCRANAATCEDIDACEK